MNEQEKLASDSLLLKEYELCQASVQRLESTIWQTFAAIGVVSIATLVAVAKASPDALVAFVIGILVIATTFIWWYMARRWWSIQHATILRMRHIEECTGTLYQMRYVYYLDGLHKLSEEGDYEELRELKDRYFPRNLRIKQHLVHKDMEEACKDYQRRGIQCILKYFVVLNPAVWIAYVVYVCFDFFGLIRSW